MKFIKTLLMGVLILLVALALIGLVLPASTHVERSVNIDAPPAYVFDYVNNMRNFNNWSPWHAIDPDTEYRFAGPDAGVGAMMEWKSENQQVGSGLQEITASKPNERIDVALDFGEMGVADAAYLIEPQGEGSKFTWAFDAEHGWNVLNRYFGLAMDGFVGPDYQKGLDNLKRVVEADYEKQQTEAAATPGVTSEEIEYSVNGEAYTGYIAYNSSGEPKPGVLVVHEWWGHNDYVRKRARMLAELGYTAFALDMYGTGKVAEHPDDAQKFMQAVMENADAAQARFTTALEILRESPHVQKDKIAAIGYCFGGATVLNMARAGMDLDGVVSFHGSLATASPAKEGVKAKVLVLHGNADTFVPPKDVEAFKAEMEAADVDYKFVDYDGVKHSFTNPAASAKAEKYEMPVAYDAKADADSWQRMQEFFDEIFAS